MKIYCAGGFLIKILKKDVILGTKIFSTKTIFFFGKICIFFFAYKEQNDSLPSLMYNTEDIVAW